ncbi:MAG: glycosyltransferase family 2 protein, partial [Flavitalea sp.]
LSGFWADNEEAKKRLLAAEVFDYNEFDSLQRFNGTHPAVMFKRIAEKNWEIEMDISKKHFTFKDRILYWIEKKTGRRLFGFRNYRII